MRRIFPSFVFLLLMFLNLGFAYAKSETYTEVQTEATGDNASVHTEITNIVNEKEVKVESDSPGEIKVGINDGEVKIESNTETSPTVTISDVSEEEAKGKKEVMISQVKEVQKKITSFLESFFLRLRDRFLFWKRR